MRKWLEIHAEGTTVSPVMQIFKQNQLISVIMTSLSAKMISRKTFRPNPVRSCFLLIDNELKFFDFSFFLLNFPPQ